MNYRILLDLRVIIIRINLSLSLVASTYYRIRILYYWSRGFPIHNHFPSSTNSVWFTCLRLTSGLTSPAHLSTQQKHKRLLVSQFAYAQGRTEHVEWISAWSATQDWSRWQGISGEAGMSVPAPDARWLHFRPKHKQHLTHDSWNLRTAEESKILDK